MKRATVTAALATLILAVCPTPAAADATFFFGYAPKPSGRPVRGFAVGATMAIVGFEFEYSNTDEKEIPTAPGLKTFMFNVLLASPTSFQVYATAGGGLYTESVLDQSQTAFGTNFGGGVKFSLAGPLRLRLDYRVFALSGDALEKSSQRFYAGANVAF
jgi:opacity protein-like surface antigen